MNPCKGFSHLTLLFTGKRGDAKIAQNGDCFSERQIVTVKIIYQKHLCLGYAFVSHSFSSSLLLPQI